MVTISLCMIVKDEEAVLKRCLESAKEIADEMIVVDTGSRDQTREIAEKEGARVYQFPWIDDFAAARNFSFSQAVMDYCLWLDADDVLLPEDRRRMQKLKESLEPGVDMVMMKYNTAFDSQGKPIFSYYRERLIRNFRGYRWLGAVHEVIPPQGKVIHSTIAVTHQKMGKGDPDRNLRIFEKLLREGKTLDPRQRFYYARELFYHERYEGAAEELLNFLQSGQGWVENEIEACRQLSQCYRKLGREREVLPALLKSLEYDIPRAEVCCDIGSYFMERERYRQAAYWYQTAASCEREDQSGGFVLPDCYDYIPYLQLCVCYDRMGDYITASMYNEKAGKCKPDSEAYLANKTYFERRLEL